MKPCLRLPGDDDFSRAEKPDFTFQFFPDRMYDLPTPTVHVVSKVSKIYTQELGCVVGVVACFRAFRVRA